MRTYIHRYFVHQPNVFPAAEVNAKNLTEVLEQIKNDNTVTRIEDRLFEWVATKNYDRLGQPTE
jgi:hypothetical protein